MSLQNILFRKLASPLVQVILLGFVCLCCPGMFNALNGLGAGGLMADNITLTNTANSALYACFAVVGLFAGSITNTLGVKITLTVCKEKKRKKWANKFQLRHGLSYF